MWTLKRTAEAGERKSEKVAEKKKSWNQTEMGNFGSEQNKKFE